jgi:protein FAM32A
MSGSYGNVVGGSLKLSLKRKGAEGLEDSVARKKKKKKKNKKSKKEKKEEEPLAQSHASSSSSSSSSANVDTRTPTQRRFDEAQERKMQAEIEKALKSTHREKIEAFNTKLERLTEHNDIPRITPG